MSGGHPTAAGGGVRGSACVRGREAVVPFCRHVPCRHGAAPGGWRIGGTGRCSCVVDGGAEPREPRTLAGGWPRNLTPGRGLLPGRGVLVQRRTLPRCISAR